MAGDDVDDLTVRNVTLDVSVILDDHEPPDPDGPAFYYSTAGGPGEYGDDWFLMQVTRNDGASAWFRVTVEPYAAD